MEGTRHMEAVFGDELLPGLIQAAVNHPEFTLFPKLPLEIRRLVWKEACFVPRLLDITTCRLGTMHLAQDGGRVRMTGWRTSATIPTVLHTSREAREEGSKHYELEFGYSFELKGMEITLPPMIYVNFNVDILFPHDLADGSEDRSIFCKSGVQHLAYPVNDLDPNDDDPNTFVTDLEDFDLMRLKTITLFPASSLSDNDSFSSAKLAPYVPGSSWSQSMSFPAPNFYFLPGHPYPVPVPVPVAPPAVAVAQPSDAMVDEKRAVSEILDERLEVQMKYQKLEEKAAEFEERYGFKDDALEAFKEDAEYKTLKQDEADNGVWKRPTVLLMTVVGGRSMIRGGQSVMGGGHSVMASGQSVTGAGQSRQF